MRGKGFMSTHQPDKNHNKFLIIERFLNYILRPESYDQIKANPDTEKISMSDWVRVAVDTALLNMNIRRN
jgi:hypothetical protein